MCLSHDHGSNSRFYALSVKHVPVFYRYSCINRVTTFAHHFVAPAFLLLILFLLSFRIYADTHQPIRFGITPVILDEQTHVLQKWQVYLEKRLQRPIEFVRRDSYGKITTHLLKGELEFGWICGYPYVQHHTQINLVAMPLYQGKPFYQSYLIVPIDDHTTQSILDLSNAVFAYSDPDSNSGYLYAQYALSTENKNPQSFFSKTFFTWEHRNTIEAVAAGLAQAGIVDSYIWDTMQKQNSILSANTRVAYKSKQFSFPPIVAAKHTNTTLQTNLQSILLSMTQNKEGRQILGLLNLDGFVPGETNTFNDIQSMADYIHKKQYDER